MSEPTGSFPYHANDHHRRQGKRGPSFTITNFNTVGNTLFLGGISKILTSLLNCSVPPTQPSAGTRSKTDCFMHIWVRRALLSLHTTNASGGFSHVLYNTSSLLCHWNLLGSSRCGPFYQGHDSFARTQPLPFRARSLSPSIWRSQPRKARGKSDVQGTTQGIAYLPQTRPSWSIDFRSRSYTVYYRTIISKLLHLESGAVFEVQERKRAIWYGTRTPEPTGAKH